MTEILKTYLQDVLGIRSFLNPQGGDSSTFKNQADDKESFKHEGSQTPRVLFLRVKTKSSVFEGPLADLYKKIIASLNQPTESVATLEWNAQDSQIIFDKIQELNPQILFALGFQTERFLESHKNNLKNTSIISSVDPSEIQHNDELKRTLWNDLKKVIKQLELS